MLLCINIEIALQHEKQTSTTKTIKQKSQNKNV